MSIPDKLKKQLEKMYVKNGKKDIANNSMAEQPIQGKPNSEQKEQHIAGQEDKETAHKGNTEQRNAGQDNEGKATTSQSNEEQYTPEDNSPARTYDEYIEAIRAEDEEQIKTVNRSIAHDTSQEIPSQVIQENVTTNEDYSNEKQVPSEDGTHSSKAGIQPSKIKDRKVQTIKPQNTEHQSSEDEKMPTEDNSELNEVQSNTGYVQIDLGIIGDISEQENKVKPRPVQIDSIPEDAITYDNYVDIEIAGKSMSAKDKPNNITTVENSKIQTSENRQDKPNKEQSNSTQIMSDEDIPIQIREDQQNPEEPKKKINLAVPFDPKVPEWVNEEEDDDMTEEETRAESRPVPIGVPPPPAPVEPEVGSVQQQAQQFVSEEQKELEQDEQEGYGQFQQDEFLSEDEARAKIATMLIDRENRETMSELNDYEIFQLSIVNAVAKDFGIGIVQQWANELLDFKVSRAREGRKEVKEVAAPSIKQQQDKKSVMDMIMGGRRF